MKAQSLSFCSIFVTERLSHCFCISSCECTFELHSGTFRDITAVWFPNTFANDRFSCDTWLKKKAWYFRVPYCNYCLVLEPFLIQDIMKLPMQHVVLVICYSSCWESVNHMMLSWVEDTTIITFLIRINPFGLQNSLEDFKRWAPVSYKNRRKYFGPWSVDMITAWWRGDGPDGVQSAPRNIQLPRINLIRTWTLHPTWGNWVWANPKTSLWTD